MLVTAFLSLAGLGFMCWLLFNLAVYALPVFAAFTVGMAAYQSGAGAFGALLIALITGAATLVLGQSLLTYVHRPWLRGAIVLAFCVPAGIAGYHAVFGLAGVGDPGPVWRQLFGLTAGVVISLVAASRLLVRPTSGPMRSQ